MNLFISWSGPVSRELARLLRSWLPYVVPNIKPWMSEDDIGKGAQWPVELAQELASTSQGIICVTSDNVTEPWLNFEAGSLAKAVRDKAYVRPLLLDLSRADVTGPLTLFQSTLATDRADMLRMIKSLNDVCDDPHPDERLQNVFGKWWDEFVAGVSAIPRLTASGDSPRRTERELLEEILTLVRAMPRQADGDQAGASSPPSFPRLSSIES